MTVTKHVDCPLYRYITLLSYHDYSHRRRGFWEYAMNKHMRRVPGANAWESTPRKVPRESTPERVAPVNRQVFRGVNYLLCSASILLELSCGVQQLDASTNLTEAAQNCSQQDQIKNLDAKIRQWSRGKEGNIRSLLSTLQLVLWPESGWKQVPLVNIIEGPSVKKAYQRALLCLHPDKLQQKGASSNQKYIAEKVFDILQEAWDHFNSISEF